ncbi:MAG: Gfo/Idh/MocA family oxidoreductase, partial [Actinomycetales bacterium]|nr:Gfo/Idh/MocA family oxidoreductase [Actinomycetales bacterium]
MSLRVGIAGYGLAGRYFHAPLLKGCGYEIAAVLTSDATRAAHVLEDFPDAIVVSTMQELLTQRLDLVVVASANIV